MIEDKEVRHQVKIFLIKREGLVKYVVSSGHSSNCGATDPKMEGAVYDEEWSLKMLGLSFSSKLNLDIYIVHRGNTASKGIGALTCFLKSISS